MSMSRAVSKFTNPSRAPSAYGLFILFSYEVAFIGTGDLIVQRGQVEVASLGVGVIGILDLLFLCCISRRVSWLILFQGLGNVGLLPFGHLFNL